MPILFVIPKVTSYVQYKVQGRHRAGGGAGTAFPPDFSRDSNYVIRDLDIRGGFFFTIWGIHRYQKQGAIKIINKIIITFIN